ncbi:hypothetical protein Tco_0024512 [Tanacetum coccineum]
MLGKRRKRDLVVNQLELLDEKLSQEDVNQKLLRSLSPEWNTHAVVWRNKSDLDTISMDDLYHNLKVYKPEVKGMSSPSSSTQNMAFVSSSNNNTSSTNGAANTSQEFNTAHGVSTANTQVNAAYFTNIDNLSDVVILLPREEFILPSLVSIAGVEDNTARRNLSPVASASTGAKGPIPLKTVEQKARQGKRTKSQKAPYATILMTPTKYLCLQGAKSNGSAIKNRIKGKSSSSLNSQNVAFVSSKNSSSTNETVNTANSVSAASSKDQASTASYADDVMFSFFANQSNSPQLDYEDLEQIDADDLEEMDLKWQLAMLTMRVKRLIKKTRRKIDLNDKETVGFDRTKIECYNCHRRDSKQVKGFMQFPIPALGTTCPEDLTYPLLDCDFHEKKMVEKLVLNNKGSVTGQKEIRPEWIQCSEHSWQQIRDNYRDKFLSKAIATPRALATISTVMHVNTAAPKPKVNDASPITYFYFKAHSPVRRVNNVTTAGGRGQNQYLVQADWKCGKCVQLSSAC